ncbi:MAG: hypothetical protein KF871_06045 [Hydrogenophaga sp.]|uniref:hypothetical protein n=1 Tax=Hydrogenophaga sp. TaxID=1904254 RepID=UPI001DFDD3D5|nr:hypothetical protein [Hydrogenophaga sp.]MBX3609441.1 hypothetical protein [Hydrogenophaga sp.]
MERTSSRSSSSSFTYPINPQAAYQEPPHDDARPSSAANLRGAQRLSAAFRNHDAGKAQLQLALQIADHQCPGGPPGLSEVLSRIAWLAARGQEVSHFMESVIRSAQSNMLGILVRDLDAKVEQWLGHQLTQAIEDPDDDRSTDCALLMRVDRKAYIERRVTQVVLDALTDPDGGITLDASSALHQLLESATDLRPSIGRDAHELWSIRLTQLVHDPALAQQIDSLAQSMPVNEDAAALLSLQCGTSHPTASQRTLALLGVLFSTVRQYEVGNCWQIAPYINIHREMPQRVLNALETWFKHGGMPFEEDSGETILVTPPQVPLHTTPLLRYRKHAWPTQWANFDVVVEITLLLSEIDGGNARYWFDLIAEAARNLPPSTKADGRYVGSLLDLTKALLLAHLGLKPLEVSPLNRNPSAQVEKYHALLEKCINRVVAHSHNLLLLAWQHTHSHATDQSFLEECWSRIDKALSKSLLRPKQVSKLQWTAYLAELKQRFLADATFRLDNTQNLATRSRGVRLYLPLPAMGGRGMAVVNGAHLAKLLMQLAHDVRIAGVDADAVAICANAVSMQLQSSGFVERVSKPFFSPRDVKKDHPFYAWNHSLGKMPNAGHAAVELNRCIPGHAPMTVRLGNQELIWYSCSLAMGESEAAINSCAELLLFAYKLNKHFYAALQQQLEETHGRVILEGGAGHAMNLLLHHSSLLPLLEEAGRDASTDWLVLHLDKRMRQLRKRRFADDEARQLVDRILTALPLSQQGKAMQTQLCDRILPIKRTDHAWSDIASALRKHLKGRKNRDLWSRSDDVAEQLSIAVLNQREFRDEVIVYADPNWSNISALCFALSPVTGKFHHFKANEMVLPEGTTQVRLLASSRVYF